VQRHRASGGPADMDTFRCEDEVRGVGSSRSALISKQTAPRRGGRQRGRVAGLERGPAGRRDAGV